MKLKKPELSEVIEQAKVAINKDKGISLATKSVLELLISIFELLIPKLVKPTSKNSNLSPHQDPHRAKKPKNKSDKKSGGQIGHEGTTLKLDENPDEIKEIKIDRRTLPRGRQYTQGIPKRRQVTEIRITKHVIEYQAEVVSDETGKEYVAEFPKGVSSQTQYGNSVKSEVCTFASYQMLPFLRMQDFFVSHKLPISEGTIDNILTAAYSELAPFEEYLKQKLLKVTLMHLDETGVNLNGKNAWVHNCSTAKLTYLFADEKRGKEAMDRAGILPRYKGLVVHDHWKPYLSYSEVTHIFCNDHISRELQKVIETTDHTWAGKLQSYLQELNKLAPNAPSDYSDKYDELLSLADQECPRNKASKAQPKERNLIERLVKFKDGTLAFATDSTIPFTNNQAERDLRMLKVKLKVSGCFKTKESAQRFCLLRSFVSTCTKNGINVNEAFNLLFAGELDKILQIIDQSG